MLKPRLVIKPSTMTTRLLLTSLEGERMRAVLPPPRAAHPRAAATVLEGLSLWIGSPLCVVLCADEQGSSSELGLCDGFGFGHRTLHYEVEVRDPKRTRRGLGSFGDLRKLDLRGVR